jgi:hypothetical protein
VAPSDVGVIAALSDSAFSFHERAQYSFDKILIQLFASAATTLTGLLPAGR